MYKIYDVLGPKSNSFAELRVDRGVRPGPKFMFLGIELWACSVDTAIFDKRPVVNKKRVV
ncbi:hypothetical protein AYI70_g7874, partial [Smittium culicis]